MLAGCQMEAGTPLSNQGHVAGAVDGLFSAINRSYRKCIIC